MAGGQHSDSQVRCLGEAHGGGDVGRILGLYDESRPVIGVEVSGAPHRVVALLARRKDGALKVGTQVLQ